MQRAEQNRLLEFLKTGLEKGITPLAKGIMRSPVADYTCPDLLADEQNVFFKKQQQRLFVLIVALALFLSTFLMSVSHQNLL